MIDTRENGEIEKPELSEATEEVECSGETQTINEKSGSSTAEETGDKSPLTESSSSEPSVEEQAAEMKDRLLRALADVENTRRRAARDVEDARKYASSGFARDLSTFLIICGVAWKRSAMTSRKVTKPLRILLKVLKWLRENSLALSSVTELKKSTHWVRYLTTTSIRRCMKNRTLNSPTVPSLKFCNQAMLCMIDFCGRLWSPWRRVILQRRPLTI